MNQFEIVIYYKYTPVADPAAAVLWHKALLEELSMQGRVLIAKEGINGTAEGTIDAVSTYKQRVREYTGADFADVWFKSSASDGKSFPGIKVKERGEIVTLGLGDNDIDPNTTTGTHIDPKTLKSWIESGEAIEIVDMRNDYEYKVGHFKNSIHPNLENFRDLRDTVATLEPLKKKKVVTVCTYGVRCEKASGYLKSQGFEDVYQLEGGIGTYMKEYPGEDFLGSLYVFDGRVLEQDAKEYEIVGRCTVCASSTEAFSNCAYEVCHKKMLVCASCLEASSPIYCSEQCKLIHASAAAALQK